MQRLFAEPTAWHTPTLSGIVPAVTRLARAHPARTLFACFTVPREAEAAQGRWVDYYRRWSSVTGERLAPGLLDLVAPLAEIASAEMMFEKPTYSIFGSPAFESHLARHRIDTLVLTGVETDVCVLASLFDAVDRGLRVIVPVDGVTSSSEAGHRAVLDTLLPRLPEQVSVSSIDAVLRAWPEEA
ncbi:cysteine hydrolase [Hyphomicrobiales bacterium BP6-180914]|uniref:Cysteine hydrolase n=2 Tax=Lichenifustis flavocetrariae TaxID=2949735 RepID=A0AA41Z3R9_9HYPH|nr:cysteine hydrolase [Lichenifustis flavocetrariae]